MPLTRTEFWFLRHGETDWNARGLSQGNVEVPLNATGIAQAHAAAALLGGRGIRSLVASPLGRAHATAEIVAAALGLKIEIEPELREVSFGVQEGQEMGPWFDDWVDGIFTPDGAESFVALRARATLAINRALGRVAPVLVVAHGAVFRALRAEMGLPANVRMANAQPTLCVPGDPWRLAAGVAAGGVTPPLASVVRQQIEQLARHLIIRRRDVTGAQAAGQPMPDQRQILA